MKNALRNVVSTAVAALLLAAGSTVATATPAGAAPSHAVPVVAPAVAQEFKADSGDRCGYGYTTGALAWRTDRPTVHAVVDVKGVVADRPLPADPGAVCPDDRAYSTAAFVAYAGRTVVDSKLVRADNDSVDFRLTLGLDSTIAPVIDRVVVQVCRYSTSPIGISYCGSPRTYLPA